MRFLFAVEVRSGDGGGCIPFKVGMVVVMSRGGDVNRCFEERPGRVASELKPSRKRAPNLALSFRDSSLFGSAKRWFQKDLPGDLKPAGDCAKKGRQYSVDGESMGWQGGYSIFGS